MVPFTRIFENIFSVIIFYQHQNCSISSHILIMSVIGFLFVHRDSSLSLFGVGPCIGSSQKALARLTFLVFTFYFPFMT